MVEDVRLSGPSIAQGPTQAVDKSHVVGAVAQLGGLAVGAYNHVQLSGLQKDIAQAEQNFQEAQARDEAVVESFNVAREQAELDPTANLPELQKLKSTAFKIQKKLNAGGNAMQAQVEMEKAGEDVIRRAPWLRREVNGVLSQAVSSRGSRSVLQSELSMATKRQQENAERLSKAAFDMGLDPNSPNLEDEVRAIKAEQFRLSQNRQQIADIKASREVTADESRIASRAITDSIMNVTLTKFDNTKARIEKAGGFDNLNLNDRQAITLQLDQTIRDLELRTIPNTLRSSGVTEVDDTYINKQISALKAFKDSLDKSITGETSADIGNYNLASLRSRATLDFAEKHPEKFNFAVVVNQLDPAGGPFAQAAALKAGDNVIQAITSTFSTPDQAIGFNRLSVIGSDSSVNPEQVTKIQKQTIDKSFELLNAPSVSDEERVEPFRATIGMLQDINDNPEEYNNRAELYQKYIKEMASPKFWEMASKAGNQGSNIIAAESFQAMQKNYNNILESAISQSEAASAGIQAMVASDGTVKFEADPALIAPSRGRNKGPGKLKRAQKEAQRMNRTVGARFNEAAVSWNQFRKFQPEFESAFDPYTMLETRFNLVGDKPAWVSAEEEPPVSTEITPDLDASDEVVEVIRGEDGKLQLRVR